MHWKDQDAIHAAHKAITNSNLHRSLDCIACYQKHLGRRIPFEVRQLMSREKLLYQSLNRDAMPMDEFDLQKTLLVQEAEQYILSLLAQSQAGQLPLAGQ